MDNLTDEKLAKRLAPFRWHQRWKVREGVYTPGKNPVAQIMDRCRIPTDLAGRRVLDVGANNACFSFECERRGASEIVAID